MKVILFMAISVNGIIADKNGGEEFLSNEHWKEFIKLATPIGNIIWGRKTYEAVKSWGGSYLEDLKDVIKIVISEDISLSLDTGFVKVKSPNTAIKYLEQQGFDEALVSGESSIYSAFVRENLADEIYFDIESAILGGGVPSFKFEGPVIKLEPNGVKQRADGIIQLHYKVIKG